MKANEAELRILIDLLMRGGECPCKDWWPFRREIDPGDSSTSFTDKDLLEDIENIWHITEAGIKAVEEASCLKS